MHKNDGASVTYFMFQLRPLESFLEKKQHSSIMTKFINNLCLYLLHAVFSLVKPAISNTYLILMGFFFKFFYSYTLVSKVSSRLLIQALHQSFRVNVLQCKRGRAIAHADSIFANPMPASQLPALCLLLLLPTQYIQYLLTSLHALYGRPAGLATRLNRKNKCKMPWTESTTTTTDTKVQFEKNSPLLKYFYTQHLSNCVGNVFF